ncbi:MBL fold metallo-hydrolase [Microbulbifer epialgicus]|uniref:MBL fold metallo-hydrolase n=1 Tax=Microbulbifer epialgicus TaxID=393907 RepID=A0ABV4P5A3_9GAMM
MKQAIPIDYFEPFTELPAQFVEHSDRIYSFRLGMNRAMVLRTSDGLAVFDSFNKNFSKALSTELQKRFPELPVRWLIYSHNHLDHIRGGAYLSPETVVGHIEINHLIQDWEHPLNEVLPVTKPIEGDTSLKLGDQIVHFLYMPKSHSSTLYGFYIESENTVFAPDMMFVNTFPPFGLPDWYYPGYIRALDRLIGLNAKTYIPSHFNEGNKADLINYRNMMVDFREVVAREMAKLDYEPDQGAKLRAIFDVAYPELQKKYGHWHGFHAMFIPHFAGQVGGTYLGY